MRRHKEIFISLLQGGAWPCYSARANRRAAWHVRLSRQFKDRHDRCIESRQERRRQARRRLRRQGHRPRRMGPQGNRHRRDRDARPDGDARGIRPRAAAARRAHLRLAAHDDPDRGADRDAQGARRRRALGVVQHLFDPGPRRRRRRRRRHAGVRDQGRDAQGLLGLSAPHLRMGRRRHAEHDPRRRRRRHAAGPSRPARRAGRDRPDRQADQRGRGSPVRGDQAAAQGQARAGTRRTPRPSAA